MAATFDFVEDNGAAAGSPASGTARTYARTEVNWKNVDDSATAYTASPITAGNNSYEKFQAGRFTGTFNQISNLKWQHTSGEFGAGLTLKAVVTGGITAADYTTPGTATNANLTMDFTATGDITTGAAVLVGSGGPEQWDKQSSTTENPAYTQYLVTQLQTTVAAGAGDTATVGLTLRYDEN